MDATTANDAVAWRGEFKLKDGLGLAGAGLFLDCFQRFIPQSRLFPIIRVVASMQMEGTSDGPVESG